MKIVSALIFQPWFKSSSALCDTKHRICKLKVSEVGFVNPKWLSYNVIEFICLLTTTILTYVKFECINDLHHIALVSDYGIAAAVAQTFN